MTNQKRAIKVASSPLSISVTALLSAFAFVVIVWLDFDTKNHLAMDFELRLI